MLGTHSVGAIVLLASAQLAKAHTWLEALRKISNTGTFVGDPGYPRGYHARTEAGFTDAELVYKILAQDATTPICKDTQQPGDYTNSEYPRLTAAAGDFIAMQYEENGHVTAPQIPPGKPYRSGNVYVYATTQAKDDDKFLDIHGVWNADGTGGDKRGKLIATHFYDDLKCYQERSANPTEIYAKRKTVAGLPELRCQTNAQIPTDVKAGDILSLMWVWDWPLNANMKGQSNETYTACAEITIGQPSKDSSSKSVHFNAAQPLEDAAMQSQIATAYEVFELGTGTSSPPAPTAVPTPSAGAAGSKNASTTPTKKSSSTTATAAASASESPAKGTAASSSRQATVTVTADANYITEYQIVTAGDTNIAATPAAEASKSSAPSVTPGMRGRVAGPARRKAIAGCL